MSERPIQYRFIPDATTGLILVAGVNRGGNRPHDSNGAFQPGANAFRRIHHLPAPVLFHNSSTAAPVPDARVRGEVIGAVDAVRARLRILAYFGHGLRNALSSAAITVSNMQPLVDAVRRKADRMHGIRIVLYACSAAAPGGFAEQLCAALGGIDAQIDGHENARHSFYNPYVRRYPGGQYLIAPTDPLFAVWSRLLLETDLWAHFPLMTAEAVRAAVQAAAPSGAPQPHAGGPRHGDRGARPAHP